jgi:DNA-binding GntR family transcriptional regulator
MRPTDRVRSRSTSASATSSCRDCSRRAATSVSTTRLHKKIVDACAGPRLIVMHDSVKPQAERYIRMYISMLTSDIRASVAEHDAIIDAIDSGEADAAQHAVQANWRHAADRIAKVIEVAGERGSW